MPYLKVELVSEDEIILKSILFYWNVIEDSNWSPLTNARLKDTYYVEFKSAIKHFRTIEGLCCIYEKPWWLSHLLRAGDISEKFYLQHQEFITYKSLPKYTEQIEFSAFGSIQIISVPHGYRHIWIQISGQCQIGKFKPITYANRTSSLKLHSPLWECFRNGRTHDLTMKWGTLRTLRP